MTLKNWFYVRCEAHPDGVNAAPVSFAHRLVRARTSTEAYEIGQRAFDRHPTHEASAHGYKLLNDYVIRF
jgi:hypothetical protein